MEFIKFVEQIPNITIAKRIASAYVADYRRLELDEIKEFLIKTAKQYTSYENISNRLEELKLDGNRAVRITTATTSGFVCSNTNFKDSYNSFNLSGIGASTIVVTAP